jgi:hypothetical protein
VSDVLGTKRLRNVPRKSNSFRIHFEFVFENIFENDIRGSESAIWKTARDVQRPHGNPYFGFRTREGGAMLPPIPNQ